MSHRTIIFCVSNEKCQWQEPLWAAEQCLEMKCLCLAPRVLEETHELLAEAACPVLPSLPVFTGAVQHRCWSLFL